MAMPSATKLVCSASLISSAYYLHTTHEAKRPRRVSRTMAAQYDGSQNSTDQESECTDGYHQILIYTPPSPQSHLLRCTICIVMMGNCLPDRRQVDVRTTVRNVSTH